MKFSPCFQELRTVCNHCIDSQFTVDPGEIGPPYDWHCDSIEKECSPANCPIWKRWGGYTVDCPTCPKLNDAKKMWATVNKRIEGLSEGRK